MFRSSKNIIRYFTISILLLFITACANHEPQRINILRYPITIVQDKTTKQELIHMANTLSRHANLGIGRDLGPRSWSYNISFRSYALLDVTYHANDGMTYRYSVGRGGNSNSITIRFNNKNIVTSVDTYAQMEFY